jgi:hypothetical protein
MTLAAGDRALRSNDPRRQCGGVEPHKGRKPDCGGTEPEPPIGGEAYNGCYALVELPNYVKKYIDEKLRKAAFLYTVDEAGVIRQKSGAINGNKVAAWRKEKRIDEIFDVVKWDRERTLFITLTHPYIKTENGRKESWEHFQKELPRYLRKLKAKGMTDFIAVKEAHRDGGCHVHLLCQMESKLLFFMYKQKRRLANKALRDYLKDNWAGDVDIMGMLNDDIRGYVKKYMGKNSHVENALRRAKREWKKDGDMREKDTDVKKMWALYYCDKLKIRSFTCSEKKRKAAVSAKPTDLVKNMNNSTEQKKPLVVKVVVIPYAIKNNPAFEPYNGIVKPNTRAYDLACNFLKLEKGEKNGELFT